MSLRRLVPGRVEKPVAAVAATCRIASNPTRCAGTSSQPQRDSNLRCIFLAFACLHWGTRVQPPIHAHVPRDETVPPHRRAW
eukprot:scaffold76740_cov28-Tisochrysis_lutea.AAC.3